jgi:hypothetical protein
MVHPGRVREGENWQLAVGIVPIGSPKYYPIQNNEIPNISCTIIDAT